MKKRILFTGALIAITLLVLAMLQLFNEEPIAYVHIYDGNYFHWAEISETSLISVPLTINEQNKDKTKFVLCPAYNIFEGRVMGGSCYQLSFNESFTKCDVSFSLYDENVVFSGCPVYRVTPFKGENFEKISIVINEKSYSPENIDAIYVSFDKEVYTQKELPDLYIFNLVMEDLPDNHALVRTSSVGPDS
jgi:hypothetical protein